MNRFKNKGRIADLLKERSEDKINKPPIFFMHIPKTAGTSLWKSMANNFNENEIFPNSQIIQDNNGAYPSLELIRSGNYNYLYKNIKFFYGHYPCHLHKFFNIPSFNIITFLRNPVERTQSHLRHVKLHNVKYQDSSMEDIFNSSELRMSQFDNLQTRFLLNRSKSDFLEENDFEVALNNFYKLSFIGLSEYYIESINRLSHLLGKNIKLMNENKFIDKVTNNNLEEYHISSQLLEDIRISNKYDMKLYEIALSKFN